MKKSITQLDFYSKSVSKEEAAVAAPKALTLAIIRQFARVYRPAPVAEMPGFVLN